MLNIFLKIYNQLFPTHSSIEKIKNEDSSSILRFLKPQKTQDTIALTDFSINTIKAVITANKFHNSTHAAKLLGSILEKWLISLPDQDIKTALVAIPLSKKRKKERGYNQVERIISNTNIVNFEKLTILKRVKHTTPQTSLSRKARLDNMKDVFTHIEHGNMSNYKRIIIVDDVVTTGSTLNSAKQTLLPHLNKEQELICLALAH